MALMDLPDISHSDAAPEAVLRLERVSDLSHALRGASTIAELFARAGDAVCEHLGFSRSILLGVDGGALTARLTGPCRRPASDRLRRRVLANPIPLRRGTEEHAIVRLGDGFRRERATEESAVVEALGVPSFVMVPVVAESRTVAVLVSDRAGAAIDAADAASVQLAADIVAHELGRVVQRLRVDALIDEVRHSSATLLALAREAQHGSVVLPHDHGLGPTFPSAGVASAVAADATVAELLTRGEMKVARLLMEGRSNREIAEALTLSPETVKTYVARILRKLGAANRAEAVARMLRLGDREM